MYVSDCGRKLEYLERWVENMQSPLQTAPGESHIQYLSFYLSFLLSAMTLFNTSV